MEKLFKMEHKVLVCLSIISKNLGAVKRIEETSFKQQIRELCEKIFHVTCVSERELENYFEQWVKEGLVFRERLGGDKRKTFYIINPNKIRTENMTVIYYGENNLLIHDTVAGVLFEGQWSRRYNLTSAPSSS